MYKEYLEYHENYRKYDRQGGALVLWCFLLSIFILFTVIGVISAPPLGIVLGVGCFFYLKFVIKRWKRCRETWKKVKAFRATHKHSIPMKGDATYCFVVPFSTNEALSMISEVLSSMGEVKQVDQNHGTLIAKLRVPPKKRVHVSFYVERNDKQCKVRACFNRVSSDVWWDWFLDILFEKYPGVDFCVSLANGDPVIAGVLNMSGDTREVYSSTTRGGTSLTGFLIGGALFGDAGAVVGGLSGKHRTVTDSRIEFSNTLLVRVIYSNGRLWEGPVTKGSSLYNEIMVIAM